MGRKLFALTVLAAMSGLAVGHYSGPFLFWGLENLNGMQIPTLQGEKFDPKGEYIRQWVPELQNLDAEYIHNPIQASPAHLTAAGVKLGQTYPKPVIDHDKARQRALALFRGLHEG